jgi:hypothetical protein
MHARLTSSGGVRFFIENGESDVTVSSSRSVVDGQWHHVVASWGPLAVQLFIDGKLIERNDDPRILKEGTYAGRYVRFGKPSSDLRKRGVKPFQGWVDEIALWNRPLTSAEVSHQFESARGAARD